MDGTKISHFSLPTDIPIYKTRESTEYKEEILVSLVTRCVLNVCEIIEQDGALYSIPLNEENIEEQLLLREIIADIILFQILTGCSDRKIRLGDDFRSKHGENIVPHNCRIYKKGSYSIFDIEGDLIKREKEEIEIIIIGYLKYLLSLDYDGEITFETISSRYEIISPFETDFIDRIYKKVCELLAIYDSEDGKKFFLEQCVKAFQGHNMSQRANYKDRENIWYDSDTERYNNLICTLRNIKELWEEQGDMLFLSNKVQRAVAKQEIIENTKRLISSLKMYSRAIFSKNKAS